MIVIYLKSQLNLVKFYHDGKNSFSSDRVKELVQGLQQKLTSNGSKHSPTKCCSFFGAIFLSISLPFPAPPLEQHVSLEMLGDGLRQAPSLSPNPPPHPLVLHGTYTYLQRKKLNLFNDKNGQLYLHPHKYPCKVQLAPVSTKSFLVHTGSHLKYCIVISSILSKKK